MRARPWTRVALAVLCAVLASGCVLQPVDETALTGLDPQLGATPAPLDPAQAERAADEATSLTRRKTSGAQRRDWIWTAPTEDPTPPARGGGLIREELTPQPVRQPQRRATDDPRKPAADAQREPAEEVRRPRADADDEPEREQPRPPRRNDEPRDREPVEERPPASDPKPPAEPAFRAIAGVADPGGDASGQSPAYADIRQLLIESDGTDARVTVAVAGDIPDALTEGEVQGIGVDFYRTDGTESDYQLFVDGDDGGWRAFLQTPDGIVQYPGSFGVGGRVFVFELPWSSLGGRKAADVDLFIDWSKRKSPLNDSGNDRAPQDGRVRVDPT